MPPPLSGHRGFSATLAAGLLWVAVIALVVLPAAQTFRQVWGQNRPTEALERVNPFRDSAMVLAVSQTILWCSLIGIAAAALATVWAWWMRGLNPRARMWALGIGLAPMLLPSYLAYAGWNLLRSPGSWLGDTLAEAPAWASVWAGRGFAIGGLALWVWPLALLVMAPAAARVPQSMLDAMRADGAPGPIRAIELLSILRRDVLRAAALCALVMAGSAIPLHVAQVNTYSIWLWSEMNRTSDPRGLWMAALPVLALAFVGAYFIIRLVPSANRDGALELDDLGAAQPARSITRYAFAALSSCIWAASVLVPLLLFVLSVREPSAYAGFWRDAGPAVINGSYVGAAVGAIAAILLLAAWLATANSSADGQARWVAPNALWLAFAGLLPGVLVGTAYSTSTVFHGMPLVIATHSARFAFIAVVLGFWLGSAEHPDLRGLRALDRADTFRGWLAACVRPRIGVVCGASLALCLLSLHEIESTVQVQPPGLDNLAQYLLDQLHYLREDQLAAAGATMTGIGLVGAIVSGVLLAKVTRTGSEPVVAERSC